MADKKVIKEIFGVAVILFAITAIASAVLASVNKVTAPVIVENERIAQEKAMKAVLPGATEFEEIEINTSKGSTVSEVYRSDAGFAVKVAPKGYGGPISMIVGVDNDLKVTGVEIISQSETAGLGTKCTDPSFLNQYIGKQENIVIARNGAKDNEIDAVSGATRTSKAVTRGVNEAISAVKMVKEGE